MIAFFDTNILVYAQQTGELGKDWDEVDAAVDDVLALVETPQPLTFATNKAARRLARDQGFSFYDALVVAAALEGGCETLYSEDMQHGRAVGGLTIVDPFRA